MIGAEAEALATAGLSLATHGGLAFLTDDRSFRRRHGGRERWRHLARHLGLGRSVLTLLAGLPRLAEFSRLPYLSRLSRVAPLAGLARHAYLAALAAGLVAVPIRPLAIPVEAAAIATMPLSAVLALISFGPVVPILSRMAVAEPWIMILPLLVLRSLVVV